jgi:hypothetical protein
MEVGDVSKVSLYKCGTTVFLLFGDGVQLFSPRSQGGPSKDRCCTSQYRTRLPDEGDESHFGSVVANFAGVRVNEMSECPAAIGPATFNRRRECA